MEIPLDYYDTSGCPSRRARIGIKDTWITLKEDTQVCNNGTCDKRAGSRC